MESARTEDRNSQTPHLGNEEMEELIKETQNKLARKTDLLKDSNVILIQQSNKIKELEATNKELVHTNKELVETNNELVETNNELVATNKKKTDCIQEKSATILDNQNKNILN